MVRSTEYLHTRGGGHEEIGQPARVGIGHAHDLQARPDLGERAPAADAETPQERGDVLLRSLLADAELGRDGLIARAAHDEVEHPPLALRQLSKPTAWPFSGPFRRLCAPLPQYG